MSDEEDIEYQLAEPFDIDHGELDGLSLQTAFALGVEWEMIRSKIAAGDPFEMPFHSENHDRILAMLNRKQCDYTIHNHDDWPYLEFRGVL